MSFCDIFEVKLSEYQTMRGEQTLISSHDQLGTWRTAFAELLYFEHQTPL